MWKIYGNYMGNSEEMNVKDLSAIMVFYSKKYNFLKTKPLTKRREKIQPIAVAVRAYLRMPGYSSG
jgi:hypothetical protein